MIHHPEDSYVQQCVRTRSPRRWDRGACSAAWEAGTVLLMRRMCCILLVLCMRYQLIAQCGVDGGREGLKPGSGQMGGWRALSSSSSGTSTGVACGPKRARLGRQWKNAFAQQKGTEGSCRNLLARLTGDGTGNCGGQPNQGSLVCTAVDERVVGAAAVRRSKAMSVFGQGGANPPSGWVCRAPLCVPG